MLKKLTRRLTRTLSTFQKMQRDLAAILKSAEAAQDNCQTQIGIARNRIQDNQQQIKTLETFMKNVEKVSEAIKPLAGENA